MLHLHVVKAVIDINYRNIIDNMFSTGSAAVMKNINVDLLPLSHSFSCANTYYSKALALYRLTGM